jgi:hypothetical protein
MAEPDKPQSPFAGMADLSAHKPVRVLSRDEIDRMLAEQDGIFPGSIIVGALPCWGANAAKE